MHTREEKIQAFGRLLDVMDALRERCPWNAEQTMESIRAMTEEEVYELSDAILKKDKTATCKEIGDLLYHMVFYAKIAQENGDWDIADSITKICEKMIFRHPHVFGSQGKPSAQPAGPFGSSAEGKSDQQVSSSCGQSVGPALSSTEDNAQPSSHPLTAKEIADSWELIKAKEKDGNKTIMSGIPDSMPAVLKAMSMQGKARGCGFDWEKREDVWDKVHEELGEVQEASEEDNYDHLEEEFGDLMFAVINAARLYDVDAEAALSKACSKFRRRFGYLEEQTIKKGIKLTDLTLAQMDAIWDEGKAKGL